MTSPASRLVEFRHSLVTRWVLLVAAIFGAGMLAMIVAVHSEMAFQQEAESNAIQRLAEAKTAERLDSEIALFRQELRTHAAELEDALLVVSTLPTTTGVLRERNPARLWESVGRRIRRAGFTGLVLVDRQLRLTDIERPGAAPVVRDSILGFHELSDTFGSLMESNDRLRPNLFRYTGMFDPSFSAIFNTNLQDRFGFVVGAPVFDEAGEVQALLVAYRVFNRQERLFADFSATTGAIVALTSEDAGLISIAGVKADALQPAQRLASGLVPEEVLGLSGRCERVFLRVQLCLYRRNQEIARFRDEISGIAANTNAVMRDRLALIALFILICTIALVAFLAHRFARPILEISEAVDGVARGEWRVEVRHGERKDEVGLIARAVAAMQLSLIERDRMRQEMVRIDAINQRRLVLDGAVSRFEDGMGVVIANISRTVLALDTINTALDHAAQEADLQAKRIHDASEATASRANSVSSATVHLSQTIRNIGERIKATTNVVHESESQAGEAEARIAELSQMTHHVEDLVGSVQTLVADLGNLGLKASLEALQAGETGEAISPIATAIRDVAARTGETAASIEAVIERIGEAAQVAGHAIGGARDTLGDAIRETSEIAVAVEEQNAATQEIAAGLGNAAEAISGLTFAVDRLRASMSHASDASGEFVETARRIADDAKAIDSGLRSFIREVAA